MASLRLRHVTLTSRALLLRLPAANQSRPAERNDRDWLNAATCKKKKTQRRGGAYHAFSSIKKKNEQKLDYIFVLNISLIKFRSKLRYVRNRRVIFYLMFEKL